VGMPDLNTEDSLVQQKASAYIDELMSVGVDGIRWDTAKHISLPSEGCDFWKAVVKSGLYSYGEILAGPTDDTDSSESKKLMKEYTDYISVTDNNYGSQLLGDLRDGKVTTKTGNWTNKGISANKIVYMSDTHDTFCNDTNDGGWTKYIDQNIVDRSYALEAARADASALYFSRPSKTEKTQIMQGEKGSTHFTSKEVAAVNHLHNACIGQKDAYYGDQSANVDVVCR